MGKTKCHLASLLLLLCSADAKKIFFLFAFFFVGESIDVQFSPPLFVIMENDVVPREDRRLSHRVGATS